MSANLSSNWDKDKAQLKHNCDSAAAGTQDENGKYALLKQRIAELQKEIAGIVEHRQDAITQGKQDLIPQIKNIKKTNALSVSDLNEEIEEHNANKAALEKLEKEAEKTSTALEDEKERGQKLKKAKNAAANELVKTATEDKAKKNNKKVKFTKQITTQPNLKAVANANATSAASSTAAKSGASVPQSSSVSLTQTNSKKSPALQPMPIPSTVNSSAPAVKTSTQESDEELPPLKEVDSPRSSAKIVEPTAFASNVTTATAASGDHKKSRKKKKRNQKKDDHTKTPTESPSLIPKAEAPSHAALTTKSREEIKLRLFLLDLGKKLLEENGLTDDDWFYGVDLVISTTKAPEKEGDVELSIKFINELQKILNDIGKPSLKIEKKAYFNSDKGYLEYHHYIHIYSSNINGEKIAKDNSKITSVKVRFLDDGLAEVYSIQRKVNDRQLSKVSLHNSIDDAAAGIASKAALTSAVPNNMAATTGQTSSAAFPTTSSSATSTASAANTNTTAVEPQTAAAPATSSTLSSYATTSQAQTKQADDRVKPSVAAFQISPHYYYSSQQKEKFIENVAIKLLFELSDIELDSGVTLSFTSFERGGADISLDETSLSIFKKIMRNNKSLIVQRQAYNNNCHFLTINRDGGNSEINNKSNATTVEVKPLANGEFELTYLDRPLKAINGAGAIDTKAGSESNRNTALATTKRSSPDTVPASQSNSAGSLSTSVAAMFTDSTIGKMFSTALIKARSLVTGNKPKIAQNLSLGAAAKNTKKETVIQETEQTRSNADKFSQQFAVKSVLASQPISYKPFPYTQQLQRDRFCHTLFTELMVRNKLLPSEWQNGFYVVFDANNNGAGVELENIIIMTLQDKLNVNMGKGSPPQKEIILQLNKDIPNHLFIYEDNGSNEPPDPDPNITTIVDVFVNLNNNDVKVSFRSRPLLKSESSSTSLTSKITSFNSTATVTAVANHLVNADKKNEADELLTKLEAFGITFPDLMRGVFLKFNTPISEDYAKLFWEKIWAYIISKISEFTLEDLSLGIPELRVLFENTADSLPKMEFIGTNILIIQEKKLHEQGKKAFALAAQKSAVQIDCNALHLKYMKFFCIAETGILPVDSVVWRSLYSDYLTLLHPHRAFIFSTHNVGLAANISSNSAANNNTAFTPMLAALAATNTNAGGKDIAANPAPEANANAAAAAFKSETTDLASQAQESIIAHLKKLENDVLEKGITFILPLDVEFNKTFQTNLTNRISKSCSHIRAFFTSEGKYRTENFKLISFNFYKTSLGTINDSSYLPSSATNRTINLNNEPLAVITPVSPSSSIFSAPIVSNPLFTPMHTLATASANSSNTSCTASQVASCANKANK